MTLKQLAKTTERAFLMTSHDLELVMQIADELWVMDREGLVICGSVGGLAKEGVLERVFSASYGQFDADKMLFRITGV